MNSQQEAQNSKFETPRHWLGVEELSPAYWQDAAVMERRGQEFHDKPVETIDSIDKLDSEGRARRDFMTIMAASMAMAGFACARRPVHKIIPYVVKPEEITPGVPVYYASSHPETGEGLLIKTREGRPIKIEGNPDHAINRGAASARAQASLLDLYDQDRLKEPVARARSTGGKRVLTWDEVDHDVIAKLKQVAAARGGVRFLTGAVLSPATAKLIEEFQSAFADSGHVSYEMITESEIAEAQKESFGTAVIPTYRLDRAEVVVSLGYDFLSTAVGSVGMARDWKKTRSLDSKKAASAQMARLYSFESEFSVTGANADERYPIRPGDELKIVLAIAHELLNGAVPESLRGYKPEAVAAEIGLDGGASVITKIARELSRAKGKSLVVAGGVSTQAGQARELQIAVNWVNSILENDGATIDGTVHTRTRFAGNVESVARLIDEMKSGKVSALFIAGFNPVYGLPKSLGFAEAASKVSMVVQFSDRFDETSTTADYILAEPHFLEAWGDVQSCKHLTSIQQPVIAPLYTTRPMQDSLLAWSKALGKGSGGVFHDYLKNFTREGLYKEAGGGLAFEVFWEKFLQEGAISTAKGAESHSRKFQTAALAKLPAYRKLSGNRFLSIYEKPAIHDGRNANNSWLQEMPDPISTVTWDNHVNVSPALAKTLDVKQDDVLEIKTAQGTVELPVYVQPGMHPSVLSIAIGYGRTAVGKVGNQVGVDVTPLVTREGSELKFSGHEIVALRKTGRFYKLAATQWHHASESRPVLNDITLAQFKKNPGAETHTNPHLRMEEVPSMWGKHEYKGYRWGMSIDLSACTGCGACVIACQAENNVPVVGRDNVRVSRQMHWIRIDRYYTGSPERPDMIFQPMLCQHCENAPCETVCPVLATVHDNEGLNTQAYNRCVGTRYCQNNCPYKVRRFNFFDHWKNYVGNTNLVWNPEVTVRTSGIMEKCTFCVQRIHEVKRSAKDEGVRVKDGKLKTACQQTCPTDAITFGDINDPSTKVSTMQSDARAFRVLEVLNTKPSISYLTKVRNKDGAPAEHGHSTGGHAS